MTNKQTQITINAIKFMLDNAQYSEDVEEALNMAIEVLKAQSEIIRCKDCKNHFYDKDHIPYCGIIDYGYGWQDEDFCSRAERRTDGEIH